MKVPGLPLVAVLALASLGYAPTAWACSRVAQGSITGLSALPAEGALAPRNTLVWVQRQAAADAGGPSFTLVDAAGASVQVTESSVAVSGEAATTLAVLRPDALLAANAAYEVRADGVALTRFTTTADQDLDPPAAPVATVSQAEGGYYGAYSCGSAPLITVRLESEAAIAMLVESSAASAQLPAAALAAGPGPDLTAFGVSEGDHALTVVAFDLAGNAATGEALSATVPHQGWGCGASGFGPVVTAGLLLWVLLLCVKPRRQAVRRR
jgi:hypothetical protein